MYSECKQGEIMAQIIRGTTPTITFQYSDITVSDLDSAILTLKQSGNTVIQRDISTAVVDTENNILSWVLTQEETLSLSSQTTTIVCDWLLTTGVRGRSQALTASIGQPAVDEVIE